MIHCPVCGQHVGYTYLRAEKPRCPSGHNLGTWVRCSNESESHVYLKADDGANVPCPYCNSPSDSGMTEGTKVKCLHVTKEGVPCITRPYLWIKEGPPCFMNHVDKMKVEV